MEKLLPYQIEGCEFLKRKRFALLADEMGLGKTPQAIIACRDFLKVLVICPKVAIYNWQNEFKKFDNRRSWVQQNSSRYFNNKELHKRNTVIISYNHLAKHQERFASVKWDLVIVDESHFAKNPKAQRTKAIFANNGIIHSTKRLWALTGTPAPNHAGELWTLLYTFGHTTLSYDGFIALYCNSMRVGNHYSRIQITGTKTQYSPELKQMLKKCSIRRLKADVLDLPPIFHNSYFIKGDDDSKILSQNPGLKERLDRELEMLQDRFGLDLDIADENTINALMTLGQSISSLRRYHGLKKIKETAELIDNELSNDLYNKVIVFGIHGDVIKTLRDSLSQYKSVTITGQTPSLARAVFVEQFQKDPKTQIFFGNIHAAGTAITLTAANQVIFIEQDWVPGNNQQAADRAHRFGQKEVVNVRHIAIVDSLDSKITSTLVRKIKEISTFIK